MRFTRRETTGQAGRSPGWRFTAAAALLALTLGACGGDEKTAGGPVEDGGGETATEDDGEGAEAAAGDAYAEACEAAAEEGEVNLYSHVTATEQIEGFVGAFEEQFPDISVSLTNRTGSAILETFLQEKRADVHTADVIQYPGIAPFANEFQDEGFIEEYTPTTADRYPADATVPGYAYPWLTYNMGAAYNTDLITDEELEMLRSYETWTDPTWQGRISAGSPGSASIQRALFQWVANDESLGEDWLRDFAALDPVAFNSVTPAAERVIAGEYVASFPSMSIVAARAAPQGAPIGWATQEYTVSNPALVAIAANAPNPNAARCLLEFHLSEEGQQAMNEFVVTDSLLEGFEPEVDLTTEEWFDAPGELIIVDEAEFAERSAEVTDLWNELIGPGADG